VNLSERALSLFTDARLGGRGRQSGARADGICGAGGYCRARACGWRGARSRRVSASRHACTARAGAHATRGAGAGRSLCLWGATIQRHPLRKRVSSRRVSASRHACTARAGAHTARGGGGLAFARYSFTSRLLCTNQPSFHSPRPPALPTLMQYYWTIVGQYTPSLPTSRVYANTPYNIGNNNNV